VKDQIGSLLNPLFLSEVRVSHTRKGERVTEFLDGDVCGQYKLTTGKHAANG
jgi:hypothetical protein